MLLRAAAYGLVFYRNNGHCREFKFVMKKTEEPDKYTACESLCLIVSYSGKPWGGWVPACSNS